MIPIFSTILIACTPDNSLICDTSVNKEQSSLISTENIAKGTQTSTYIANNIPTQPQTITEVTKNQSIASENQNLNNTDNHKYVGTQTLTDQTNNLASQAESLNDQVANSSPSAQTSSNISIDIEMPPETNAKSLGKPIQLNNNNYSPAQWNQAERILITKNRQGDNRLFKFAVDSSEFKIVQENQEPETNNKPASLNVVEVLADKQEYLDQEQIIKATGNVVIRFSNGLLVADQVLINLVDRVAVAQNNVKLKRGEQVLRGDRFEYYFVEDKGVIYNAQGEIYQPSLGQDVQFDNSPIQRQPLTSQFEFNQPLRRVVSQDGYTFAVGSSRDAAILGQPAAGGNINRYRFQAERVNFDSEGWQAINIRITNDPFSPPEFEVRADTANLTKISDLEDELVTTNSRLVFDQNFSIPLFRNRLVFSRRDRRPGLFNIGFDGDDLGGLYIERDYEIYSTKRFLFTLTPQFLIQRAFFGDASVFGRVRDDQGRVDSKRGLFEGSSYGLVSKIEADFSERSSLRAIANFTGLDLDNIDRRLRANVRFNQKIGDLFRPYNLSLEYNYRERLFNGSLGFQTVQGSFGGVIFSPVIPLGSSPFRLQYQGSIQNIRARTDKNELLKSNRKDDLVNLTRIQGAASINGGFDLWRGEPLPATAEEGLKYTSTPVVPYLRLSTGLRGVTSYYSNDDSQPNLTANVRLQGQLGHFSRSYLDYTAFSVNYRQGIVGTESPFLFDRFVDRKVLSLGLTQQVYGPVRIGLQTFYNIDDNKEISTDYFLEYSRRTYNVILRYNPVLQIGSLNLRISDFNWEGNSTPFDSGTGIKPVVDGLTIDN